MQEALKSPDYKIIIDDIEITTTIKAWLMSLTLTDNRGLEADQLNIELDDSNGSLAIPARGAEVKVWMGWKGKQLTYKGLFTVDEITHSGAPDILTITARSADLSNSGLNTQRERAWHEKTINHIISTIADEVDLTPTISADLLSKLVDHIDQTNESNISFLTRLAEQFDAISTVKDGRLLFMSRASGLSASGKTLPTVTINRSSGDNHHFSVADRQNYSGVKATYNDIHSAIKGEVLWTVTDDEKERNKPAKVAYEPINATGQYKTLSTTYKTRARANTAARKEWRRIKKSANLSKGIIGVKANYNDKNLQVNGTVTYGQAEEDKRKSNAQKLAERDNAKNAPPSIGIEAVGENVKVLRHVYSSKENATRAARNEWRKIKRGVAEFGINLAEGDAELFPDLPAIVSGWKPQIDNTDWLIIRATHAINQSGFTTRLDFEIKATEIA